MPCSLPAIYILLLLRKSKKRYYDNPSEMVKLRINDITKIRQLCRAEISTKACLAPNHLLFNTIHHLTLVYVEDKFINVFQEGAVKLLLVYTWHIGSWDYWLNHCHRYYLTVTQPNQWQRLNDCHQNGPREQTMRNAQREKDVISLFSLLASSTYQLKRDVRFWDPHSWRL